MIKIPPFPAFDLHLKLAALEETYRRFGKLEAYAWNDLKDAFLKAGRPMAADYTWKMYLRLRAQENEREAMKAAQEKNE